MWKVIATESEVLFFFLHNNLWFDAIIHKTLGHCELTSQSEIQKKITQHRVFIHPRPNSVKSIIRAAKTPSALIAPRTTTHDESSVLPGACIPRARLNKVHQSWQDNVNDKMIHDGFTLPHRGKHLLFKMTPGTGNQTHMWTIGRSVCKTSSDRRCDGSTTESQSAGPCKARAGQMVWWSDDRGRTYQTCCVTCDFGPYHSMLFFLQGQIVQSHTPSRDTAKSISHTAAS